MQTAAPELAYFGKVPAHGDFVRGGAGGAAVRAMDAWVQEGLYAAKQRLGAHLAPACARAGSFGFFLDAGPAGPLAGVLQPSRDRVGRVYPLVIAAEADASVRPADAPERFADFVGRAAAVARDAAAGSFTPADLAAQVAMLGPAPNGHAHGNVSFDQFLRDMPVSSLWTHLWGHADDTRKYLLFKNLLDLVPPLRGRLPERFPIVLRFPLGADAPPRALEVRFWLDVVARLLGETPAQPSFFWSLDAGAPGEAFLLLTLRPPPPELFTYLLVADPGSDTLCVLERLGADNAALAALSIPAHYGRLLEDDHLSLADFVRQI